VDPFTNTIFSFGIKGSDLKKLLRYTRPATSASLRYKVRRDEMPNANGKFDWQLVEATLNGQPIEDDKVYPGAASSYYFGKEVQKYAIEPKDSARPRIEYLAEFIKKNTPVKPTADGRVVLEGGSSYE